MNAIANLYEYPTTFQLNKLEWKDTLSMDGVVGNRACIVNARLACVDFLSKKWRFLFEEKRKANFEPSISLLERLRSYKPVMKYNKRLISVDCNFDPDIKHDFIARICQGRFNPNYVGLIISLFGHDGEWFLTSEEDPNAPVVYCYELAGKWEPVAAIAPFRS